MIMKKQKGISTFFAILVVGIIAIMGFAIFYSYQYIWVPEEETTISQTEIPEVEVPEGEEKLKDIANNLIGDYLKQYKSSEVELKKRLKSYTINSIDIDIIEEDCFGFTVNYSVETFKSSNNDRTDWIAGNGKVSNDWVRNKIQFVDIIKENGDYKIREMGTGRSSLSCNLEEKKDETAGWKVYRNEEYGYEVSYPKDWKSKERTLVSNLGHRDYIWLVSDEYSVGSYIRQDELNIDIWDFSYYSYDQLIEPGGNIDQSTIVEKETVIDDWPATELSYVAVGDIGSGFWKVKKVFIQKNQLLYLIECSSERCDQILSTFRFIE